ncbi:MAG: DUF445 family protein [Desulfobacterales bacterium]|nr:DUF445 family protein [Desulfobacterales bacterium]
MLDSIIAFFSDPNVLKYASMPFISGIVGWGTNWVAVKMTFLPLEPIGKPPFFGWQGIVPAKCEKMAKISVDVITSKLLSVREIFSKIDSAKVAEILEDPLINLTVPIIDEAMLESSPVMWETLPVMIKSQIYGRSAKDIPRVVKIITDDIINNVDDVFDLESMVVSALVRDKALLNSMFLEVGHKEFKFIEISGFYFGFLFGILQMLLWIVAEAWWQLPVGGLIVGYLTNWLALKMIFEPAKPKKIGPFTLQGLFHKRQKEVAEAYGKLVTENVLNSKNIIDAILRGPLSDQVFRLIKKHTQNAVDSQAGMTKPLVLFTIGTKQYIELKNRVCDKLYNLLPNSLKYVQGYAMEAMDIANTLTTKLGALPSDEFEGMLRPAFQEDEWILIAVGALLGLVVGIFQLVVLFGGSIGG